MRLLVLGGTHHVGRAVVEQALARDDEVTTLNRGLTGHTPPGVHALTADRTVPGQVAEALGNSTFDAVIDTWSGAPREVLTSARLLVDRVGHYGYVSSRSVYQWPIPEGVDESAAVVAAQSDDAATDDYAVLKRGGELAVVETFGERGLVTRPGLILGPFEQVGRLVWWLRRIERGGRVLAPGPVDRPLQYIDGRDLADWMLAAADQRLAGLYNVVSKPGHTTMGELLGECCAAVASDAELVWVDPEVIEAAGLEPWTEIPIWLPPTGELVGLHDGDVSAAYRLGLSCRPVGETVRDTWNWLLQEGDPPTDGRRPPLGMDADREQQVLATLTNPH